MHPWHDVYIDDSVVDTAFPVVIEVPEGSKNSPINMKHSRYKARIFESITEKELTGIPLGEGGQRLESAQDLTWALLNSPAFLFNR